MSDASGLDVDKHDALQANRFDDEIDLRELFGVLWAGKGIITAITAFAAALSVAYALFLPNIYESKALLAPKGEGGGGLAAVGSHEPYHGLHAPLVRQQRRQRGLRHVRVGQPRDGDPRASFAVVRGDRVQIERVSYDFRRTQAKILAAGLHPALAERLARGK